MYTKFILFAVSKQNEGIYLVTTFPNRWQTGGGHGLPSGEIVVHQWFGSFSFVDATVTAKEPDFSVII
jgi:hypothetical protein